MPRTAIAPEEARSDFAQVKAKQKETWQAGDYSMIGTTLQIVSEELCEQADLRAGSTVLDVCTGSGNTAIAAARRWCRVTGLDYAPRLLDDARRRVAAEHLDVDFHCGDGEALPFAAESFDVVTSTYGVQFSPNHAKVAAELVRVCRPGGRIALANWGPGDFVAEVFKVSAKYLPPPAGVPSPLVWGDPEQLAGLLDGTTRVAAEVKTVNYRYRSAGHFVDHLRTYYGPTIRAFDAAGDEAEGLRRELTAVCEHFNVAGDTAMVVPARYLAAVFQKQ